MSNDACFQAALRILSYSDKSEKQLTLKLLEKEFSAEEIAPVIEKLKDYNYINDARLAEQIARSKQKTKGNRQILASLKTKGLSAETATQCLDVLEPERERCEEFARKKIRKIRTEDPQKKMQKLRYALASNGFSFNDIQHTLNKILKSDFVADEE